MPNTVPHRKARAAPEFLDLIFSVPESDNNALAQLEKKLSENLDEFLTQSKVAGEIPLSVLVSKFSNVQLPEEPCFVSDQVDFLLKDVIPYCVHTGSPRFIGHMTSAIPYFLQSLSKCMVALHQNVVKIETSRALTFVERQTIAILHRLIYSESTSFYHKHTHDRDSTLGVICSGGTLANIMGLWIARNRFMHQVLGDDFAEGGLIEALMRCGKKNLCVFVSERGHYSLSKAVDLLGLGKRQLISIPVDSEHRINMSALAEAHAQALKAQLHPLAVVGIAGTTETGHIDPLQELANFAQTHQLHFHVDAAWGGTALFSNISKHLLAGIERADTVVIDGHKQLYLPMGVGMLFIKSPVAAASIQHQTQYIIRNGSFDLGRRHLEGSRAGMSLLVHSALRIIGRQGYELLLERNLEMARTFVKLVEAHPEFQLITSSSLNIVTYRYCPLAWRPQLAENQPRLNELNTQLQKRQRENGKSFISRTQFRHPEPYGEETTVLRAILANPLTKVEHLKEVLAEQALLGQQLQWELRFEGE
jgi:aspartate 1-decarboxylase